MFKFLKKKKSTFITKISDNNFHNSDHSTKVKSGFDNRAAKSLVLSLATFFILLFPSMRYGFAEETSHKQNKELVNKSAVIDKEIATTQILASLPDKTSEVKLKNVEVKAALTALVALDRTPALQIKPKQQALSKLNHLETKPISAIKAKKLSINSITQVG